jgi:cyclohexa-1,5-dienecarbonyl-CoA hydratase
MSKARLSLDVTERIAHITLAAPKANILDRSMIANLREAVRACSAAGVNAVVISGEGPHFSFGASVEEHLPEQIAATLAALHDLIRAVAALPAVTVAAVRGQCLGGGLELALACDLIVAAGDARFACPEIKLGVFPPAASALLPVRLGAARAAALTLTGCSWTAEEAHTAGLVHWCAAAAEFDQRLLEWLATTFVPRPAVSLRVAAEAVRRPVQLALDHDLPELERVYLERIANDPDALEGLQAFLDKREPRWARVAAAVGK